MIKKEKKQRMQKKEKAEKKKEPSKTKDSLSNRVERLIKLHKDVIAAD